MEQWLLHFLWQGLVAQVVQSVIVAAAAAAVAFAGVAVALSSF
jgi:hypothetical protein